MADLEKQMGEKLKEADFKISKLQATLTDTATAMTAYIMMENNACAEARTVSDEQGMTVKLRNAELEITELQTSCANMDKAMGAKLLSAESKAIARMESMSNAKSYVGLLAWSPFYRTLGWAASQIQEHAPLPRSSFLRVLATAAWFGEFAPDSDLMSQSSAGGFQSSAVTLLLLAAGFEGLLQTRFYEYAIRSIDMKQFRSIQAKWISAIAKGEKPKCSLGTP